MKKLCEYDWPGNIAEIKNTVIRLVIMADGAEIEAEDLASILDPKRAASSGAPGLEEISPWSRLDEIERKEVSAALERNRWIRRRAADDLGLTFRQMNYRVKKFGLETLIREHRTRTRRTEPAGHNAKVKFLRLWKSADFYCARPELTLKDNDF